MSDKPTILIDIADHIATVTINRPSAMNALNWLAYDELEQAFFDLQENTDVRCIILTGAGNKAFCAGEDIKETMPNAGSGEGAGNRLLDVRPRTTPAATAILELY